MLYVLTMSGPSNSNSIDLVAAWDVHLADGIHLVEFEHGTTTGRRLIRKEEDSVFSDIRSS